MKAVKIIRLAPINETDESKVQELVASMKESGFIGCPMLVWGETLLTGSHRLAALKALIKECDAADDYTKRDEIEGWDVAEDVTDICQENYDKFVDENGYEPDIDYSNIGWLLAGSWVEEYKDQIEEW